MYPKFIEVRDADQGCMLSLNVTNICGFNEYCDDADKTVIAMTDGVFHVVDHTYEEIRQMITESGCLIRKQDPRLDLTHPLTIDDLKSMVGEPVWNTSIGEWGLVTRDPDREGEITEGYFLRYQDGSMTVLEEEWMRKYPHYRMRVRC